jgi:hypothetical protein
MADLQAAIEESRPMLEDFLQMIGLHRVGTAIDFPAIIEPFCNWLEAQTVTEDDRFYVSARLAAFICEYLVDVKSAVRLIDRGRIVLRVPIEQGIMREFDPYSVALGMFDDLRSFRTFLTLMAS